MSRRNTNKKCERFCAVTFWEGTKPIFSDTSFVYSDKKCLLSSMIMHALNVI